MLIEMRAVISRAGHRACLSTGPPTDPEAAGLHVWCASGFLAALAAAPLYFPAVRPAPHACGLSPRSQRQHPGAAAPSRSTAPEAPSSTSSRAQCLACFQLWKAVPPLPRRASGVVSLLCRLLVLAPTLLCLRTPPTPAPAAQRAAASPASSPAAACLRNPGSNNPPEWAAAPKRRGGGRLRVAGASDTGNEGRRSGRRQLGAVWAAAVRLSILLRNGQACGRKPTLSLKRALLVWVQVGRAHPARGSPGGAGPPALSGGSRLRAFRSRHKKGTALKTTACSPQKQASTTHHRLRQRQAARGGTAPADTQRAQ